MRKTTNIFIGLVVIAAMAVFGVTLWNAVVSAPTEPEAPAPQNVQNQSIQDNAGVPSRLIIPALNIDANVQKVGITKRGTMSVPTNFTDVGWYKYGTVPGVPGTAVIDGHLDNGLGLDGVFKHLDTLQPGDDVYIVSASGARLHYKVYSIGTYDFNTVSTVQVFNSGTNDSYLNLVTCEGAWVKASKTYSNRLVVFTKLVQS